MLKDTLRFDSGFDTIKTGQKTDTWRHGDKSAHYEPNQIVDLINIHDNSVFGRAMITQIELKKLCDADDKTAHGRGYQSKDDFIASFRTIYPDIQPNDIMTIIHFAYINGTSEP